MEKGNMTAKVTRLIALLRSEDINSKKQLLNIWDKNPYYLLDAMLLWVNE